MFIAVVAVAETDVVPLSRLPPWIRVVPVDCVVTVGPESELAVISTTGVPAATPIPVALSETAPEAATVVVVKLSCVVADAVS